MAFKNEDIAIHLNETFEQSTWEAYAVSLAELHAWKNEEQRKYMAEPERRAHQRAYEARPEVRARKNERQRAAYAADPEKHQEYKREWREAHRAPPKPKKEARPRRDNEYNETKKAYNQRTRERRRERDRLNYAKKRAERLAAAQQLADGRA